jgi:hypothetical protein
MPDSLRSFPYIVADGASQPAPADWDREFADSPVEESGFEPLVPLTPKRGRCRFAGFVTATRRLERGQGQIRSHVASTASNHCAAASALKIRSVDREMRWR